MGIEREKDIYKKLGLNQPQQRFAALPVPDVKKQMAAREQFAKPGLEKEQALTKELGDLFPNVFDGLNPQMPTRK